MISKIILIWKSNDKICNVKKTRQERNMALMVSSLMLVKAELKNELLNLVLTHGANENFRKWPDFPFYGNESMRCFNYCNNVACTKMTHRFPIKRHNVNQVFYRTSRTIEKSKLNFITLCQVNYLLKDFKTFENILRPVDWTMAYDNCIRKNFPEISEIRSAWANQDAEYWMRMFDKGSHWSSIQGLKIGKIVVNIFDALFFKPDSESHKMLRWII